MSKQGFFSIPIALLLMGLSTTLSMAQLPAFPSAEGGAKFITGGRGGQVLYVSTLEDTNTGDLAKKEGSLRWCLNQASPKTILFKVSGIIALKSPLIITKGDVTIAGQSAPGDGICLKNYTTQIDANNVILRYLRFRLGDEAKQENDAISGSKHNQIMIDHCSMSWSVDECVSFYSNKDFTMQWCFVGESLRNSIYEKGMHGYGGVWGGENASFHHNLIINHDSRTPRFNGWKRSGNKYESTISEERVDFRNNVIFNWGSNNVYGGEAGGMYNLVNNYYRYGPASITKYRILQSYSDRSADYGPPHGRFYLAGNFVYGNTAVTSDNSQGIDNRSNKPLTEVLKQEPFNFSAVTTHSAEKAYPLVLNFAGCNLVRDSVDIRYAHEALVGRTKFSGSKGSQNGLIDTQTDVGGWPIYQSAPAPLDTDMDGMPDAWETANGLNPASASDGITKTLSTEGYTNLEVYLNGIVKSIIDQQNNEGTVMEKLP